MRDPSPTFKPCKPLAMHSSLYWPHRSQSRNLSRPSSSTSSKYRESFTIEKQEAQTSHASEIESGADVSFFNYGIRSQQNDRFCLLATSILSKLRVDDDGLTAFYTQSELLSFQKRSKSTMQTFGVEDASLRNRRCKSSKRRSYWLRKFCHPVNSC